MKLKMSSLIPIVAISCLSLTLCSCSKKEEPVPPTPGSAEKSANTTAADAEKAVTGAAADAQKAASGAAADAQKQIQATAADAQKEVQKNTADAQKLTEAGAAASQNQAQGLIQKAKQLIADKKYSDALESLKGLSNLKLTSDQQKIVDDLKTQVEKLMASDAASGAAKSVGGLLDEKK